MRRFLAIGWIIIVAVTPFILTGCQSPKAEAARALSKQIAARQEARSQSLKLYQQGMAAYRDDHDSKTAAKYLRQAVSADDQNAAAWLAIGVVDTQLEQYYPAAKAFHQAANLTRSSYEPYYDLGLLYESVGYFDQAIKAYKTALNLAPDQLYVIENLARTYVRARHDPKQASELVQRALGREFRPAWRKWLKLQSLRLGKQLQSPAPG